MNNNILPPGFISIEDAVALINKDTRQHATVDTDFMVGNLCAPYLRVGGTFNIRLMKNDERGRAVYAGEKFVLIETEYQLAMLEHAIVEHYKQATGRADFDPKNQTRSLSTTVDDEENPQAQIVTQKKPMTKAGEDITTHAVSKTNGQ